MSHSCIECECPLDARAIAGLCLHCYIASINDELNTMQEHIETAQTKLLNVHQAVKL